MLATTKRRRTRRTRIRRLMCRAKGGSVKGGAVLLESEWVLKTKGTKCLTGYRKKKPSEDDGGDEEDAPPPPKKQKRAKGGAESEHAPRRTSRLRGDAPEDTVRRTRSS
jgi:hypothetical protein